MPTIVRDNERSYAIDLISQINTIAQRFNLQIKKAGGERTISTGKNSRMFPDVVLYGNQARTQILQGWELKLPDTLITDEIFIKDAQRKAVSLGLNSCFIWNFTSGVLYIRDANDVFQVAKQWNDTSHIRTRIDVETYRADWENAIETIVVEINQYLIDGNIAAASLGTVISDTVVATIIQRNKMLVSEHLKICANADAVMKAFLSVWWDEMQAEYSSDEPDMYKAYAKIVILNWSNRLVFAHLIKRLHNVANAVATIDYSTTPEDANVIFGAITASCDFYNIFSALEYSVCIPDETWEDIIDLNYFLEENGISEIEQTVLQTVLESSVSTSKRELAGQFTTPLKLAELLAKITVLDWTKPCIDPCCGTGSITQVILNHKKTMLNIWDAVGTTWAADKYGYPLQVANISLTSPETINIPNRIFKHNVLNLVVGEPIQIIDPCSGQPMNLEIPQFGAISSNLPFVPFESLKYDDLKIIEQISDEVQRKTDIILSGRSDLYCFIIFALHRLAESHGRIGVITSNSWLGTSAGKEFFKALNMYFEVNQIHISGVGRWFNNAQVVTVILVITKKDRIMASSGESSVTFCTWNKTLRELQQDPILSDILVNSSLLETQISAEVITLSKYTQNQISELQRLNISLNAMFHEVLWLLDIKDKLIPISDVFTVFRGERRGWDDLFYPNSNHGIEPKFIKKVLKNARRVTTLFAEADNDAFCCSLSKDALSQQNLNGALSWIERFESGVNGTGRALPLVLARANMQWYEMKDTLTADICTTMNPDKRLFFAKFKEPTFINQRLIGLKSTEAFTDISLYHALLNSIVGMFYIESIGFGRGLGALDISNTTLRNAFLLNPVLIDARNRTEILEKFKLLCKREILNTVEELQQADRIEFDMAVLRAFGIEEYYEKIKFSLLSMQKTRLSVRY